MTLIVYLDTQDYINLFNEPENGPNHRILKDILYHRDRGEIVLGFSFATIIEFITKPNVANRPERVRRGQLIKDVCGQNAFPSLPGIAKGASFPNDGMWMFRAGETVISARQFRGWMHTALVGELVKVEGLNRKQRRQLGRKASIAELIRKTGSTWGRKRSDWGGFPVSDELLDSRILERFMKGQCSDREFETRINAWISDPAEYSRIIYDYADHPNVIAKYFGKPLDDLEQNAKIIQGIVVRIRDLNTEILQTRTKLIEAGIDKSKARKLTKQISIPEPDLKAFEAKLETVVSKGRAGHFTHYMVRIMKTGYSFKRSDVMDLMQMCYTYDCDLFRCDKAMANTFRDYEPFKGKLVSRFSELPDRIAAQLEQANEKMEI